MSDSQNLRKKASANSSPCPTLHGVSDMLTAFKILTTTAANDTEAFEGDKTSSSTSTQTCICFSLAEITSATNNFDDDQVVGKGGFGKVYKGMIYVERISHVVAIKRLDSMSSQGASEFRAEIKMLSKLRHCHLVSLIGYCDDNKEMILVYEYMPHGTLYHHLHKVDAHFSWVRRLKIAIGAARGLDYLHTGFGTEEGIIHRDVKSSNILLDENWAAMISDFGLSKIGPTNQLFSYVDASVKGTFGYIDPEYFYTRKLTRKTDVYAYGVVLFELLSGRLPVDERYGEEDCSLVRWAKKCVKDRKFSQMVDSNMRGKIPSKCLRQFAQIADRCLHSSPRERPTMAEVVVSLQLLLAQQEKWDNSADPSGIIGFAFKYLVSFAKGNADQNGPSSPTSPENNVNRHSSVEKGVSDHGEMPNQYSEVVGEDLNIFTYEELHPITRPLRSLGKGRYGEVYKIWVAKTTNSPPMIGNGMYVAVKRLHHCEHFDPEMLKEFHHPNLVKLIGYCLEEKQILLAYEFMSEGNFTDLLSRGVIANLPLATKVKIVVGIARGIVFLHRTQQKVGEYPGAVTVSESQLYRHNILLTEDFTAKLSDYDVTKLVRGCYMVVDDFSDYYYYPGAQSVKLRSNLSGFTVVFAEVIKGKQISNWDKFLEIDGDSFLQITASICLRICNEVDSESTMLKILSNNFQVKPKQNFATLAIYVKDFGY